MVLGADHRFLRPSTAAFFHPFLFVLQSMSKRHRVQLYPVHQKRRSRGLRRHEIASAAGCTGAGGDLLVVVPTIRLKNRQVFDYFDSGSWRCGSRARLFLASGSKCFFLYFCCFPPPKHVGTHVFPSLGLLLPLLVGFLRTRGWVRN